MLKQVPKISSTRDTPSVEGKHSLGKRSPKKAVLRLPSLTRQEIEDLVSDSAINQQLEKLEARGVLPKEVIRDEPTRLAAETSSTILADVVDAVRWHDQKDEELKALKTQDVHNQDGTWLDTLIENFITFDPTPNDSADKATEILKELDKELVTLEEATFGPEAADYVHKLRRELELVIEKLQAPNATPQTKTHDEKQAETDDMGRSAT